MDRRRLLAAVTLIALVLPGTVAPAAPATVVLAVDGMT